MENLSKQDIELVTHACSIGCFTQDDLLKKLPNIKKYCQCKGISVYEYVHELARLSQMNWGDGERKHLYQRGANYERGKNQYGEGNSRKM